MALVRTDTFLLFSFPPEIWWVCLFKNECQNSVCVCVCVYVCVCAVAQLYLAVSHPMDCSPPDSSIHGVLQVRTLEWVAIFFYRGSSRPRDQTQVSCIAGRFFTI